MILTTKKKRISDIKKILAKSNNIVASTPEKTFVFNTKTQNFVMDVSTEELQELKNLKILHDPIGKDILRYTPIKKPKKKRATNPAITISLLLRSGWVSKEEIRTAHQLKVAWELHVVSGGLPEEDDFAFYTDDIVQPYMSLPNEMRKCLYLVCIQDTGIETVETLMGWPSRSGKVVLQIGLRALTEALKLPSET